MTTILHSGRTLPSNEFIGTAPSRDKGGIVIDFDKLEAIEGPWYRLGEQEVQLRQELMPIEVDSRLSAGMTLVRRLQRVAAHIVEGSKGRQRIEASTAERFYRAELHPSGTAAERLAREKIAKQKKPPKPFAPVTLDPTPLASQPERVRSLLGVAAVTAAEPAVRGREAVMAWLAKQEVILEPLSGQLLARVRGGIPSGPIREVLTAYARLLPSWAAGSDVGCDMCEAPAVVPAMVDAVLCAEHAA